jgi:hypothetical protein
MSVAPRAPAVYHCTSEPLRFFGRSAELALLDEALRDEAVSVVGLMGPGGQGKTAIVQQWLQPLLTGACKLDGLFFWSFYRGKDVDLCLRELYAYAARSGPVDVSASYCVDHLLPVLRHECWAVVLDGAEVVQHESRDWYGRFLHPELGRLLEELATEPLPGVVVLTTRFPLPTLRRRRFARLVDLTALDAPSARALLRSVGVVGADPELDEAAGIVGMHAKGVELLGTWLAEFHHGRATSYRVLPDGDDPSAAVEERGVAQVLAAFRSALPQELSDIVALATAFRQPPTEGRLLEYLVSDPVSGLLPVTWGRKYPPFDRRGAGWLQAQVQWLVKMRLLERVGAAGHQVIDAHPLVRRGFEHHAGRTAAARAGFLRGRPDRRPPASLDEAREEVELFHAYCDAGLWNEADSTFVALDNPKHRFLAPAFERDLLVRFFPDGDWRRPPLWPGFGRWRSLAICLEMLGQFEDALEVYRPADAALCGDALIALGRLQPLLNHATMPAPWQNLWRAYRAHALCLAGRVGEAVALCRALVPVDIYEWVHVFECLLRAGELGQISARSLLYNGQWRSDGSWADHTGRRLLLDWKRAIQPTADLEPEYRQLLDAFDRGGLPWERALVRLGYGRWLLIQGRESEARAVGAQTLELARRCGMPVVAADAAELAGDAMATQWRNLAGYRGPGRP